MASSLRSKRLLTQICRTCQRSPLVVVRATRPVLSHFSITLPSRSIHTSPSRFQAVQVSPDSASPASLQDQQLRLVSAAETWFDPANAISNQRWANRIQTAHHRLTSRVDSSTSLTLQNANRILFVGSSLSQIQDLVVSLLDEPLRDQASTGSTDLQLLGDIFSRQQQQQDGLTVTISYRQGPASRSSDSEITLDRQWLLENNTKLTILVDPASVETAADLVYDNDMVFFVTDTYALDQCLHRPATSQSNRTVTLDLINMFASKPHTHVVINQISPFSPHRVAEALEMAIGPAAAESLLSRRSASESILSVSTPEAIRAHAALRRAVDNGQTQSQPSSPIASSAFWTEFSSSFTASNVSAIPDRIKLAISSQQQSPDTLLSQSVGYLLDHCLDEALAYCRTARAHLDQIASMATETQQTHRQIVDATMQRIWPADKSLNGSGQIQDRPPLKEWTPATSGSQSAVDEALAKTKANLDAVFDRRLQWWKIIWKVDDIRAELEAACFNFAGPLESELSYESGRLSTLQIQQVHATQHLVDQFHQIANQLASLSGTSIDAAMLTNDADAYRSRKLRSLQPETLMAPIHHRRLQLFSLGGPIDTLACKTQSLAISTSLVVITATAGIGSASVLGSGIASTSSLLSHLPVMALEPFTGLGLILLIFTIAGWRIQGQLFKFKRQFFKDWQRLVKGLDYELRNHLLLILKEQIISHPFYVSQKLLQVHRNWDNRISILQKKILDSVPRSLSTCSSEKSCSSVNSTTSSLSS